MEPVAWGQHGDPRCIKGACRLPTALMERLGIPTGSPVLASRNHKVPPELSPPDQPPQVCLCTAWPAHDDDHPQLDPSCTLPLGARTSYLPSFPLDYPCSDGIAMLPVPSPAARIQVSVLPTPIDAAAERVGSSISRH